MSESITGILVIGGAVAVVLLIRYIIGLVVHKGVDAISNAIVDKKNAASTKEPENLADRYREKSFR